MRKTAWFLIFFQVLFLNLYLPAHTRGAVSFAEKPGGDAPTCCEMKHVKDVGTHSQTSRTPTPHTPTSEERRCCAVCYLASAYIPVEPIVVYLDFRTLIRQSHERAVAQVRSLDFPPPFWPNGPPQQHAA